MTIVHNKSPLQHPSWSSSSLKGSKPPQETASTREQLATEYEVQPYFVDLNSLPPSQLEHLQQTGLLLLEDDSNDNDNNDDINNNIRLVCDKHYEYLQQTWKTMSSNGECCHLKSSFTSLDSSRTWMIYWTLHACDLLQVGAWSASSSASSSSLDAAAAMDTAESKTEMQYYQNMVDWIQKCWTPVSIPRSRFLASDLELDEILRFAASSSLLLQQQQQQQTDNIQELQGGGFGGGPGQMPHAATTYAAVMALCILATTTTTTTTSTNNSADTSSTSTPVTAAAKVRQSAMQLLESIRLPLYVWMKSLRVNMNEHDRQMQQFMHYQNSSSPAVGAFCMQDDGEMDVRATYCVVAVAKLLNMLQPHKINNNHDNNNKNNNTHTALCTPQTIQFLLKCQTWEGGFGGEPHNEAHGGYTYCATAALQILGHLNTSSKNNDSDSSNDSGTMMMMQRRDMSVDMDALTCWLAARQKSYEGGFDGRTNKLVDGCYSFWQGAAMAICSMYHHHHQQQQGNASIPHAGNDDDDGIQDDPWLRHGTTASSTTATATSRPTLLLDDGMLERYILLCAQDVQGGLRDKPSKRRDFYHSCYCLSGLSIAQHNGQYEQDQASSRPSFGHATQSLVAATHPCYNLRLERVRQILQHFHKIGLPTTATTSTHTRT